MIAICCRVRDRLNNSFDARSRSRPARVSTPRKPISRRAGGLAPRRFARARDGRGETRSSVSKILKSSEGFSRINLQRCGQVVLIQYSPQFVSHHQILKWNERNSIGRLARALFRAITILILYLRHYPMHVKYPIAIRLNSRDYLVRYSLKESRARARGLVGASYQQSEEKPRTSRAIITTIFIENAPRCALCSLSRSRLRATVNSSSGGALVIFRTRPIAAVFGTNYV